MQILLSAFHTIVPLIVLLGVLIFVHELGHFSVAKFFGVRVEVFSLGFGRKIFRYKKGDTEYCLSLVPFGGYVKMYGDDPSAIIPDDQKKFSFTHQPVGARIAVVLAGPLMNALWALLVFSLIGFVGEEALKPKVGDVLPTAEAYKVGFRTGDIISKADGQEIQKWDDFRKILESKKRQQLSVEVKRNDQIVPLSFSTSTIPNRNPLGESKEIGDLSGLSYISRAPVVGIQSNQSPAWKAGLRSFDLIEKINGQTITFWQEADQVLQKLTPNSTVNIEYSRYKDLSRPDSEKTTQSVAITADGNGSLGIENSELYLVKVVEGTPAQMAGLEIGDRLISVAGITLHSWDDVVHTVQSYKPEQAALPVTFVRQGIERKAEIIPKFMTQTDQTGTEQKNFALGVATGLAFAPPETLIAKEHGFGILKKGFSETVNWTVLTAKSFGMLAAGKVSAKSIGGPLMIGKLASDTWKIGLAAFLKIMGIISINLFLLNLLPVPVLDGGHLLFFGIEVLKGSPLSFRKLEIMQQIGMVLLLTLMVFAVFNDLSRFFGNAW